MEVPRWKTITREERYFTSVLHHELIDNVVPFSGLLCPRLGLNPGVGISDVGFEVCFFRDGARKGVDIIERHKELEKQTFDFMLFLSDRKSAVVIEVKAQQGYSNDQIKELETAKGIIEESKICPIRKIHLVGLCSSRYCLKEETEARFNMVIRWRDLIEAYPNSEDIFARADSVYGE